MADSVPATIGNNEVWTPATRDELLGLLRDIRGTLNKPENAETLAENIESYETQKDKKSMFRWESATTTPIGYDRSFEFDRKYSKEVDLSPKSRNFVAELLRQHFGLAIHIPYDGRIQLAFTMDGLKTDIRNLRCPSSSKDAVLKSKQDGDDDDENEVRTMAEAEIKRLLSPRLQQMFEKGLKNSRIELCITDCDPWNGSSFRTGIIPTTELGPIVTGKCAEYDVMTLKDLEELFNGIVYHKDCFTEREIPHIWGNERIRKDQSWLYHVSTMAPWSRLISFKGLAYSDPGAMDEMVHHKSWTMGDSKYRDTKDNDDYLNRTFAQHLGCGTTRGSVTSSPYTLPHCFNITFFEIVDTDCGESQWMTGKLFNASGPTQHESTPIGLLRYSAFTVKVVVDTSYEYTFEDENLLPFYTVLLLCPETFKFEPEITACLQQFTAIGAEIYCIVAGLGNIIDKWTKLLDCFELLLANNIMNLIDYSSLLFDDENFTRSRRYFWAIGCLSEFDSVIADNIKQWTLYYEARIHPLMESNDLAARLENASVHSSLNDHLRFLRGEPAKNEFQNFKALVKQGQNQCVLLNGIRGEFKQKLETAKALRDGLFNASALVESRASTKLGENVKWLTYVSIFYLPLGFCAALWAVPNIQDSATKIPFVVTALIVGAITYLIVFNLDFMTNKFNVRYLEKRRNVIKQMQQEPKWMKLAERFEEFKPTSESQIPTEWWILGYWIRSLFRIDKKDDKKVSTTPASNITETPTTPVAGADTNSGNDTTNPGDPPAKRYQWASRLFSRFSRRRETRETGV